jgi:PAS domain S-box-containing protein
MHRLLEGKKFYAAVIAAMFVIAVLVTFGFMDSHYRHELKNTIRDNRSNAKLVSSLIYEHQRAAIGILESYAQRPLLKDAVKEQDFDEVIGHLKTLRRNHSELDALFITDVRGIAWANYPMDRSVYGKNMAYRDWYKGLSRKWKPYVSSVFQPIVSGRKSAVVIAVPVTDNRRKIVGILGAAQRASFFAALIKSHLLESGKNISILDKEGNIIFSSAVPYEKKVAKWPDGRSLEKALAGEAADLEMTDTETREVSYISVAPIRELGWSVIVGQKKSAVMEPLYGYFILSGLTGFGIFLLLSVGLLSFRREYEFRRTRELRKAEEKYIKTFQSNPACVGLSRLSDGLIVEANEAMLKCLGYSREEFIGRTVFGLRMWNDLADRERMLQNVTDTGRSENQEFRLRTKTGEVLLCNHSAELIDIDDKPHVIFTFFDITERKRAEEKLWKSEERLRAFVTATSDVVYQMSPDWKEMRRLRGRDLLADTEEPNSTWFEKYIHPEDRPRVTEAIDAATRTKSIFELEHRVVMEDGTTGWTFSRAIPLLDANGDIVEWFGTARDITKRKQMELLSTSLNDINRLVHSTSDTEEVIKRALSSAAEAMGCQTAAVFLKRHSHWVVSYAYGLPDNVIGARIDDSEEPHAVPSVKARKPIFIDDAENDERVNGNLMKRWGVRSVAVVPLIDRDQTVGVITLNYHDQIFAFRDHHKDFADKLASTVSLALRNASLLQELKGRTAQLEESNKELESFSYTVSHDLRAPLRAIDGFSRMIVKKHGDTFDEDAIRKFDVIRGNVRTMGQLIEDLLAFSRLSRKDIARTRLDMTSLVQDSWREIRASHPARSLSLTVHNLDGAYGDRSLIKQVYVNLLANAVKFTRGRDEARIEAGCYSNGNEVVYFVRDNGIGFDMAYHNKLFDVFQRLHHAEEYEGTGVGLAIVQRIVQRHGGRVWAEGKEGEGATFYFALPSAH